VEAILSIGMLALLGLLFVMGLKYLELLPPKEISEAPEAVENSTTEIKDSPEPETQIEQGT